METNLNMVIDQVSKDKGIDRQVLVQALEEAILASAKKAFGAERDLHAEYNEEKGAVDLSQTITVVETIEDSFNEITLEECAEREIDVEAGDEMVFPIYYLAGDEEDARAQDEMYGDILKLKTYRRSFGRIAAQTAKQVIIQRIRDAERFLVYNEYKDRKDELVTGIVRRFERGNIIVDLGRAEAILPLREQCSRESYRTGDRVQAYVIDVQEHARGPQIVLSRTCPQLLMKLFELEVPEIHEGVVRIESAAREPGSRAKIAVSSGDRDVDPVGACVGMRGARVQAVVQELRGEKIDIVPFSQDAATFVCNALQPAEVSRVLIDEGNRSMEIIVPDDQLSLGIGRKGQNVRLASQLTGWRLDIHSESRIQEIKDRAWESLSRIAGCTDFLVQTLYNHGIRSAVELIASERSYLLQFPGVDEENIDAMLESAQVVANEERERDRRLKLEAEHAARIAECAKEMRAMIRRTPEERMLQIKGMGASTLELLTEKNILLPERLMELGVDGIVSEAEVRIQEAKQLFYGAKHLLQEEADLRERVDALGIRVEGEDVLLPGQESVVAESMDSGEQDAAQA